MKDVNVGETSSRGATPGATEEEDEKRQTVVGGNRKERFKQD